MLCKSLSVEYNSTFILRFEAVGRSILCYMILASLLDRSLPDWCLFRGEI